ncbi:dorsal-ventral patterning protein tolloid-like [Microplitis mediator]|uniref:dorsal-ventral patterning protein tolloid-like n=1 Tax=Microplitis mediator TaxID=375433 RepID=UPI002555B6CD|nr:dorsal-ventral patterning protein tolloid-like [Microplitis mediator]
MTINSYAISPHEGSMNREHEPTNYFEPERPINITRRSSAVNEKRFLWDDGIIPYEIGDTFNGAQRKLFKRAMRHWEQSTCIKFVERIKKIHDSYLLFTKLSCGCCSLVGKRGKGGNPISIDDRCNTFGTVVHELGHAIGFFHEHNRPDRDDYVEINHDIIDEGSEYNFEKSIAENVDTLNQPYDYFSIMHYPSIAIANSANIKTLTPKIKINGRIPDIGQRSALSTGDITATKLLYNCSAHDGSFFEPWDMIVPPVHPNNSPKVSDKCKWTIRAAEGERIKVILTSWDIQETPNCTVEYVEIKDGYQANSRVLARICGEDKTVIVTASNFVSITYARNRYENYHLGFILKYETVCGGDIYIESNDSYYLESPNYPESYKPNKQCHWNIKAPYKHYIVIQFNYFELEESNGCKNDFVKVREGGNRNAPIIGKYCGERDRLEVASLMRRIFLSFVTNGSKEAGVLNFFVITINSYVILPHEESINRELEPTNYFEPERPININRRSLAVNEKRLLWDDGIIPYEIEDVFNGAQRKLLKQAMRHWEQSTCIKFVEKIPQVDDSYLLFTKLNCGCCSVVGRQGTKRNPISLHDECSTFGTIVHELGHAIGFLHEQNRPDRDDYVQINFEAIEKG